MSESVLERCRKWHKRTGAPTYKAAADEIERLREALQEMESQVPSNWCDSLLTGDSGITVPADCPQIEKLLRGVRARIKEHAQQALKEQD